MPDPSKYQIEHGSDVQDIPIASAPGYNTSPQSRKVPARQMTSPTHNPNEVVWPGRPAAMIRSEESKEPYYGGEGGSIARIASATGVGIARCPPPRPGTPRKSEEMCHQMFRPAELDKVSKVLGENPNVQRSRPFNAEKVIQILGETPDALKYPKPAEHKHSTSNTSQTSTRQRNVGGIWTDQQQGHFVESPASHPVSPDAPFDHARSDSSGTIPIYLAEDDVRRLDSVNTFAHGPIYELAGSPPTSSLASPASRSLPPVPFYDMDRRQPATDDRSSVPARRWFLVDMRTENGESILLNKATNSKLGSYPVHLDVSLVHEQPPRQLQAALQQYLQVTARKSQDPKLYTIEVDEIWIYWQDCYFPPTAWNADTKDAVISYLKERDVDGLLVKVRLEPDISAGLGIQGTKSKRLSLTSVNTGVEQDKGVTSPFRKGFEKIRRPSNHVRNGSEEEKNGVFGVRKGLREMMAARNANGKGESPKSPTQAAQIDFAHF